MSDVLFVVLLSLLIFGFVFIYDLANSVIDYGDDWVDDVSVGVVPGGDVENDWFMMNHVSHDGCDGVDVVGFSGVGGVASGDGVDGLMNVELGDVK